MRVETDGGYTEAPRGLREWIFIFVLCSTQLFTQGALGYILIPLGIVGDTFGQGGHEQAAQMSWHVAAYSLTIGTFILVAGRLGDMYGARTIFISGWIWFGVWSIICGCSAFTGSTIFFDTSRALQGIGPAMLLPNALAVAGRTYPPGMKKNIVFSMIAMCAPLGCALGGLTGAALAQYVWWPWAPWISGMASFAVAFMAYLVVPRQKTIDTATGRMQGDWIGSALGIAGLILLNVSWIQAPIDGWPTPYVYVLLILGLLSLVLFFWYERKVATKPVLDVSVYNGRTAAVLLTTGLGWSSFSIWFYYMFQFLQHLRGTSSLESAIQFIPGALSGAIAPIFTAWALPRLPTSWLMVLASFAFFTGCLLQTLAPVEQSYWFNTFWSFVVMAWGMDVSFPVSTLFISDSVPLEHQGTSASLVNTVINYSMAIGLGIAGTVEVQMPEGASLLDGYRRAQYTSVGLSGLGLVISVVLAVVQGWKKTEKTKDANAIEPLTA